MSTLHAALAEAARHPHKGPDDTDASMLLAAAKRLDGGYEPGGSNTKQTVARVLRVVADLLAAHPGPEAGEVRLSETEREALDERIKADRWGYYLHFEATGLPEVDRILSAVGLAAKAFHHTDGWNEDLDFDYGPIAKGATCADFIQRVAEDAAARLAEVAQPARETRVEWGVKCDHGMSTGRLNEQAARSEVANAAGETCRPRVVSRTVTSFPDVVGEWEEVAGDE